jgi:hypothetical protein
MWNIGRTRNEGRIMIFALDRSRFISLAVLLIVGLVCLLAFIDGGESSAEIWTRRGTVLLIVSALVTALSVPWVFGLLHTILFARFWWFPNLNGEWESTIRSNWPRIRKTFEAARDQVTSFDPMRDMLSDDEAGESVTRAKVTIRTSLILFSIKLEPVGSNRISRTRFVRPEWNKPALPELSYVYEQFDPDEVAQTDVRKHFGAGVVSYDADTDTLTGEYWTQRREDVGFNTAGTITLKRKTKRARRKSR